MELNDWNVIVLVVLFKNSEKIKQMQKTIPKWNPEPENQVILLRKVKNYIALPCCENTNCITTKKNIKNNRDHYCTVFVHSEQKVNLNDMSLSVKS